ncbi:MAG: 30S ribosomal protein S4 [Candidatus Paceibacterota bacterium]
MKIGPKYKICKRLGAPIFEKCQTQKFALSESKGGRRRGRRRRQSEYGLQLAEKQKARYTYGMTEGQFSRYVKKSLDAPGSSPIQLLFQKLEGRLDNVAYRLGLAKTRRMARQLVSHGHILVNGRKVSIPSYQVQESDTITVRNEDKGPFRTLKEEGAGTPPAWLAFDAKKLEGRVDGQPTYDETEHLFSLSKVLEFYTR